MNTDMSISSSIRLVETISNKIINNMFKLIVVVALFAQALASPAPEANPAPKADPKPQFLAAYSAPVVAAPGVAYTSAYTLDPLAYSSYVAPAVYPSAYSAYSPYAASYVVY